MHKNSILLLLALSCVACASVPERQSATVVYESEIQDAARARQIALRYSAFVGTKSVSRSHPFRISPCSQTFDTNCSYVITAWVQGCTEMSNVTERCEGSVCTHEFAPPHQVVCE